MDCIPPGSYFHQNSRQEYWSGLLFPSPGNLPDPGIKPASPPLAGRSFTTEPPGRPLYFEEDVKIYSEVNLKEKQSKGRKEKGKQKLKYRFSALLREMYLGFL